LHIIPVIDLLDGVVVHAKKGLRSQYQPIISSLTTSSEPLDIVKAFMDIYPFNTLYIADLNRIQGRNKQPAVNDAAITAITDYFPNLALWIDSGAIANNQLSKSGKHTVVLGSESFSNIEDYQSRVQVTHQPHVLSLDYLTTGYKGPEALLTNTNLWPQHVIVMTLQKVGANLGVDIETIQALMNQSKQHNIYAAGGVRNLNDLKTLSKIDVQGALVASALHNKQLSAHDITSMQ